MPYPPARLLLCVLLDPIPLKKNGVNIGLKNDCHFLKCELAAAVRQYRTPQGFDVSVTSFPCEMEFHFSPSALLGDIPRLVWKFRFKRIDLGKVVIIFCGQLHKNTGAERSKAIARFPLPSVSIMADRQRWFPVVLGNCQTLRRLRLSDRENSEDISRIYDF